MKIILLKYKLDELTLDEAINEILNKYIVSKKYDIVPVKEKLTEFFKNNLVDGYSIKKFSLRESYTPGCYDIIPEDPYLDECYVDDVSDDLINQIGVDLGLKSLGFVSWVYPK